MSDESTADEQQWSTEPPPRRLGPRALAFALVLALLFVGGFALVRWVIDPNSAADQSSSGAAAQPKDPASSVLPTLILQPADVGPSFSIRALARGDQLQGQATSTLDLCNGRFPSESHRTARLQDALLDAQGTEQLSTEAVLYSNPGATAQAFNELRGVAAKCPNGPVASPVGEPTVTTRFNPAPDTGWAATPTVDRLAYSFTTTGQGRSAPSIAVYLRRGRALMGVYFAQPAAAQPAIKGQASIEGIVALFATRLSQLPASTVGAP